MKAINFACFKLEEKDTRTVKINKNTVTGDKSAILVLYD